MVSEGVGGVSISPGLTVEQVREFVRAYEVQPYGLKGAWLAGQGVTYRRFSRWRSAVFKGDLDRGLIPREGGVVTPGEKLASIERERARERAAQDAELARLHARVRELEQTNEALGKAIGLLHQLNEQEPDEHPPTNAPSDSSPLKTRSSPS